MRALVPWFLLTAAIAAGVVLIAGVVLLSV